MKPLIVAVDDDEADIELLEEAIVKFAADYEFKSFVNPIEAVRRINDGEVTPQYLFLDINMPVMHGNECLKQLRSKQALDASRIIMFSTAISPAMKDQLLRDGANYAIEKPTRFDSFKDILQEVLH